MTKEKAKALAVHYYGHICLSGLEHLIDDIYDHFESRTCKNCKYYYTGICTEIDITDDSVFPVKQEPFTPEEGFGCNKFERR